MGGTFFFLILPESHKIWDNHKLIRLEKVDNCFADGSCDRQAIDIMGRNDEFPEEIKEDLLSKIPRQCAGPDDFVLLPSGGCDTAYLFCLNKQQEHFFDAFLSF